MSLQTDGEEVASAIWRMCFSPRQDEDKTAILQSLWLAKRIGAGGCRSLAEVPVTSDTGPTSFSNCIGTCTLNSAWGRTLVLLEQAVTNLRAPYGAEPHLSPPRCGCLGQVLLASGSREEDWIGTVFGQGMVLPQINARFWPTLRGSRTHHLATPTSGGHMSRTRRPRSRIRRGS